MILEFIDFRIVYDHEKQFGQVVRICLNVHISTISIDNRMSSTFVTRIGLKQGETLPPLLLDFGFCIIICDSKKTKHDKKELKFYVNNPLFIYRDDVYLLTDGIKYSIKILLTSPYPHIAK